MHALCLRCARSIALFQALAVQLLSRLEYAQKGQAAHVLLRQNQKLRLVVLQA